MTEPRPSLEYAIEMLKRKAREVRFMASAVKGGCEFDSDSLKGIARNEAQLPSLDAAIEILTKAASGQCNEATAYPGVLCMQPVPCPIHPTKAASKDVEK